MSLFLLIFCSPHLVASLPFVPLSLSPREHLRHCVLMLSQQQDRGYHPHTHGDSSLHLHAALLTFPDTCSQRVTVVSPCSVWRHCPVRMSHTRTVESAFPDTRMLSRSSMPLVSDWWPVNVWTHPPEQDAPRVSSSHFISSEHVLFNLMDYSDYSSFV